jgi:hypothetical protein
MSSAQKGTWFPTLRGANPETDNVGQIRLGDAAISGRFPPLRRPDERITDPGTVRLGDAAITGRFPARR